VTPPSGAAHVRAALGAGRVMPLAGAARRLLVVLAVLLLAALSGAVPGGAAHAAPDVRADEWQLPQLHAADAWQLSTGSGVTVAVLDSGVDADHPDLAGRVEKGIDLVDGSTDGRKDFVGHGTSVADLIAGRRDGPGVVGLAYDAKILPVRVLDAQNRYGDAATVASGVRWAVDHGARVINLSLGGAASSDALHSALRYALDHDVVVVACAGNTADRAGKGVWYPARASGVVAVSGLNPDETFWSGSVSGPQVALSAPADGLIGARPGGYWHVQGTSFAAPLVSATAALIRSKWPTMSAANVVNRLIATADDKGPRGRDDRYGYGMVDPEAALTASVGQVAANPLDTEAPSASSAGGAGAAPTASPSVSRSPRAERSGNTQTAVLVGIGAVLMVAVAGFLALALARTRRDNT
jgi:type VII secretion-associated serine protease mycosin